jgi:hypothetical protein
MKSVRNPWSRMMANWKATVLLALPIAGVAMWFGFSRGYDDLWLYGLAVGLSALHIAKLSLNLREKWRGYRLKNGQN